MKQIGIVTFHYAHNYGAVLQTVALQEQLKKSKYDVNVVNYKNINIANQYKICTPYCNNLLKNVKRFALNIIYFRKNKKRFITFDKFISKNINLTQPITDINNLKKMDYDSLIVGSDQVWNINITNGPDNFYMLNSDLKAKKISYAASVGDDKIFINNYSTYLKYLSSFDSISVRENSTNLILNEYINKNIVTTLDPTFLLTKNEWLQLFNTDRLIKEKYIFVYSVGFGIPQFYNAINKLSKKTGYKVIHFEKNNYFNKFHCKNNSFFGVSPYDFLNLLYNSEFVITSSFHGLAFSINFQKQFAVVPFNKPERILNVLNLFNLSNRILKDEDMIYELFDSKINWDYANKKIVDERKKSIDWLLDSIEK